MSGIPDLPTDCWIMQAYDYARLRSKLPDSCIFWLVMAYAGAAIQDRVLVDWAGKPVYPNIPLMLVTPSGYGKTSAMHLIQRLFGRELPYIIPEDSTAESAVKMMGRNGGTYFRNSVAVWVIPELADIFGKKDYQQGLIARVTRLLDNPRDREVSRSTKDEVIKIPGVAVLTWIAGTTYRWLSEHVEEAVSAGGFLPRLMVVHTNEDPKNVPDPERDDAKERELQLSLRDLLSNVCLRDPKIVKLSDFPQWKELFDLNYADIISHKDDEKQAFISRRDENTLRIFLILHTLSGGSLSLSGCRELAMWLENQVFRLSLSLLSANSATLERVMVHAKRHPEGASFATLCRNAHLSARVLRFCLQELTAESRVEWNGRVGDAGVVRPLPEKENESEQ